jgi:hypothetical protein
LPFVLQEVAPWSMHCAAGSIWFTGTLVQMPSVLGSAQDWQAPAQGELQQNPWAQERPTWHSIVLPQTAPGPLRPQEFVVGLQVLGVKHWLLATQMLKQDDPLQMKGAQGRESGATHWPVVLQVEGPV